MVMVIAAMLFIFSMINKYTPNHLLCDEGFTKMIQVCFCHYFSLYHSAVAFIPSSYEVGTKPKVFSNFEESNT